VDALWEIGRQDEARDMFVDALRIRNRYGLLSEDVHLVTGKLWGNFPQTYSMSGLILTAIKLSRSWGDRYWRGSASSPTGSALCTAEQDRADLKLRSARRSSVTAACGSAGAVASRRICRNRSRSWLRTTSLMPPSISLKTTIRNSTTVSRTACCGRFCTI